MKKAEKAKKTTRPRRVGLDEIVKPVWIICIDRYGDESMAKSGMIFSVIETGNALIESYANQTVKPIIKVMAIGLGLALSDYLTAKGFPHICQQGLLARINGADVYKFNAVITR